MYTEAFTYLSFRMESFILPASQKYLTILISTPDDLKRYLPSQIQKPGNQLLLYASCKENTLQKSDTKGQTKKLLNQATCSTAGSSQAVQVTINTALHCWQPSWAGVLGSLSFQLHSECSFHHSIIHFSPLLINLITFQTRLSLWYCMTVEHYSHHLPSHEAAPIAALPAPEPSLTNPIPDSL